MSSAAPPRFLRDFLLGGLMDWFKHKSLTWNDEKMACVTSEYGLEIYGFWWRILEILAAKMSVTECNTSCEYPIKVWANYSGVSPKTFRKLSGILNENKLIIMKNGQNLINIDVPNLVKYRDEYTKRKHREAGVSPD